MDDLISRKEAIVAIRNLYPGMPRIDIGDRWYRWRKENDRYIECEEVINKLPSAQTERKKGFWEWGEDEDYRCSNCQKYA